MGWKRVGQAKPLEILTSVVVRHQSSFPPRTKTIKNSRQDSNLDYRESFHNCTAHWRIVEPRWMNEFRIDIARRPSRLTPCLSCTLVTTNLTININCCETLSLRQKYLFSEKNGQLKNQNRNFENYQVEHGARYLETTRDANILL